MQRIRKLWLNLIFSLETAVEILRDPDNVHFKRDSRGVV